METSEKYPTEENKHETTFSLIDGMVTVLEEEEEIENAEKKKEEEEEADSSHYSVGGDNGW
jgi:hypothetical protein